MCALLFSCNPVSDSSACKFWTVLCKRKTVSYSIVVWSRQQQRSVLLLQKSTCLSDLSSLKPVFISRKSWQRVLHFGLPWFYGSGYRKVPGCCSCSSPSLSCTHDVDVFLEIQCTKCFCYLNSLSVLQGHSSKHRALQRPEGLLGLEVFLVLSLKWTSCMGDWVVRIVEQNERVLLYLWDLCRISAVKLEKQMVISENSQFIL